MATLDSSPPLKQMIRAVRSLLNSLNTPLAACNFPIDGLNLAEFDDIPSFVAFDPLAQFIPSASSSASSSTSSPASSPVSPQESTRFFHQSSTNGIDEMRSPPSKSFIENSGGDYLASSTVLSPLLPSRHSSTSGAGRSQRMDMGDPILQAEAAIDSLVTALDQAHNSNPDSLALFPEHQSWENHPAESPAELQDSGDRQNSGEGHLDVNAPRHSSPERWLAASLSPPAFSIETASTAQPIQTLAIIEQIASHLLTNTSSSESGNSSYITNSSLGSSPGNSSPGNSSPGNSSLTDLYSDVFSSALNSTHASQISSNSSGNYADSKPPDRSLSHSSNHSLLDAGFDILDTHPETPLEDMAETLTLLVNDVLAEQARRHGVDLS